MTHQVESENQSFGESHANIHHDPMTKEEEESKEPHTTEVGISSHVRGGARNFTGYVASTKVAKSGTRGGFVLARVCSYQYQAPTALDLIYHRRYIRSVEFTGLCPCVCSRKLDY